MASEQVSLLLAPVDLSRLVGLVVLLLVQHEVPELVSSGEDPSLHRYPTPGVDYDRRASVACADRESEERVGLGDKTEHPDPGAILQQPADVADRLARQQADGLPGAFSGLDGARWPGHASSQPWEPERDPGAK